MYQSPVHMHAVDFLVHFYYDVYMQCVYSDMLQIDMY